MDNLKQDLSYLQDWVFHFNSFTEQWAAIPRESYDQYWNDYKNTAVLRSKTLNTLLELLHKAKGSSNVIEHIINGEGAE
jgi:predicted alternative tryptophan synthase beta-subunit